MIQAVAAMITDWDARVCSRIFGWNGKARLDALMRWLTRSGDGYLYVPFGLILYGIDASSAIVIAAAGGLAFLIELPVQKSLKHLIKRSRPFASVPGIHHLVKPPDQFSFPSGHTAGAFIIAVVSGSVHAALFPILLIWAAGVGLSRVYNGVHYPTDVLAGAVLGSVCAHAGFLIVRLSAV
jgi:undecaprenyl-diphosphatase